ncbi:T-complex protein 1 subunit alpha [Ananas comosus]|uniref:T-complex protein 1 subunit alpha n=1 Tax=Ananas comosus TaxID=4615 RepID=A0A199UMV8_ANACO|nr:T-complex protein 1 subunit alpha [Ananas comosus]
MAIMAQSPDILGEGHSGQDVRTQNNMRALVPYPLRSLQILMACQAVANIVKSSLGLVGLDKFPSTSYNIPNPSQPACDEDSLRRGR